MANKYKVIHDAMAPYLQQIQDLFLPDKVRITVVIRNPERADAEIVLGDDEDYNDVIAVLEKYKHQPAKIVGGEVGP